MAQNLPHDYPARLDEDYSWIPGNFWDFQQKFDGSHIHCFWCGEQHTTMNPVDKSTQTCDKCRRFGPQKS